jgi:lipopolysaccharide transport system ATP-binding protein
MKQEFPRGAIIGVIGENTGALLREAGGRYLGPTDALDFSPVQVLALDHTLALADALSRAQATLALDRVRKAGTTVLITSHEPHLLRGLCDEVWLLEDGGVAVRGDPREILDAYQRSVREKFQAWGATLSRPLDPVFRKGDGRAEIVALKTFGASEEPKAVWQSGEQACVRVTVRYRDETPDPVIGIMIRSRIGLEVYGTNTELENIRIGPRAPGDEVHVDFRFACDLCAGGYTLTAASHDPDGTAHDWVDDAVAFTVTDTRYTAGVANLRAQVTASHK